MLLLIPRKKCIIIRMLKICTALGSTRDQKLSMSPMLLTMRKYGISPPLNSKGTM
ncbi:hypothetical protein D3C75_1245200 [compost metagenome]